MRAQKLIGGHVSVLTTCLDVNRLSEKFHDFSDRLLIAACCPFYSVRQTVKNFSGSGSQPRKEHAIDPSCAPVAALIGRCRFFQSIQGAPSDIETAEGVPLARQAIEAGRDDPGIRCMAAFTLSIFAGEHAAATTAVQRAFSVNPNSVHAWMTSGWNWAFLNRPAPAIKAFERVIRLSPLDPFSYLFAAGLAFAHAVAHQYEVAIEWADRSSQQQPPFVIPIRLRIALCAYLDRAEEARGWLRRLVQLQPGLTIAKYEASALPGSRPLRILASAKDCSRCRAGHTPVRHVRRAIFGTWILLPPA
jgi:tetratricopeptide (TPR) repeat protein